jgi:hypothetical protein
MKAKGIVVGASILMIVTLGFVGMGLLRSSNEGDRQAGVSVTRSKPPKSSLAPSPTQVSVPPADIVSHDSIQEVQGSQYALPHPWEDKLTPKLEAEARSVDLLYETDDLSNVWISYDADPDTESQMNPGETVLEDWQIQNMVAEGGTENLRRLQNVVLGQQFDMDSKQDALANLDTLFDSDADLIAFLRQVVEDNSQANMLRLEALRRLADFGVNLVSPYSTSENEELASEVDLVQRLEAYRLQEEKL